MTTSEGVYLYAVARDEPAVTRDGGPGGAEGVTGVAGRPVRSLAHRGLLAFLSTVPLDQFDEERLRASMEDLDWLEETARAHHRVVEAVARVLPTAPVRLVTVYNGEDQVRTLLDERHDEFAEVLTRVAGRQEWGVKAYLEPGAADPMPDRPETVLGDSEAAAGRPGTAYLRRRRATMRDREQGWRRAAARAEAVHEALMSIAVAGHRHRAQDPRLSGREEQMLLNGAYLVDEDRADEFAGVLDGLDGQGVAMELIGPWAPYSFTALDGEVARGGGS